MNFRYFLILLTLIAPFSSAEPLPIHEFRHGGNVVGKLYAEFTESNLMHSAEIKMGNERLYSIKCSALSDENSIQIKGNCDNFHGFVIENLTDTEISITMTDESGHRSSDTATIIWDPSLKRFTFEFIPSSF